MTGTQAVTRALQEIGWLGAGQAASGADLADSFGVLQRQFDSWAAERLMIPALLRTSVNLVSGTRDYTIGTGGDINIVRPNSITRATITLDRTATDILELPIAVFTDLEWTGIGLKTYDAGTIRGIYYDHAWSAGLGQISTWPTINTSICALYLYTPQAVVGYSAFSDDLTFPPGWEEAIVLNLARRLARQYGRADIADLELDAREALRRVKSQNVRLTDLPVVTPFNGVGPYDINSDSNLK